MEIKKSHKADLEHLRKWMFIGGIGSVVGIFIVLFLVFALVGNMGNGSGYDEEIDDDLSMDLDIKPNDQRDMISAAEKTRQKEQSEEINKVDNLTDIPPEILNVIKFTPEDTEDEELKEDDKEEPINQNDDDPETMRVVEELPQYPGGMVEFMKWLTKNLRYPPVALQQKIQGKVMITFIVNKDGSLSDLKVAQKANRYLDAEALRVAKLMPKWTPGKDHGKVCRTMMAIPIVFAI